MPYKCKVWNFSLKTTIRTSKCLLYADHRLKGYFFLPLRIVFFRSSKIFITLLFAAVQYTYSSPCGTHLSLSVVVKYTFTWISFCKQHNICFFNNLTLSLTGSCPDHLQSHCWRPVRGPWREWHKQRKDYSDDVTAGLIRPPPVRREQFQPTCPLSLLTECTGHWVLGYSDYDVFLENDEGSRVYRCKKLF